MRDEGSSWPKAGVSEVIGLLEMIDDEGGKIDVYKIGKTIGHKLDQLLSAVETAKTFGFVAVEEGDILLTELGKTLLRSSTDERKKIIAQILPQFDVFKELLDILYLKENHVVDLEYLEEIIGRVLPEKETEKARDIILDWGRFAELIRVDSDEQEIHLEEEEEEDTENE
jgi:NitT/TauT family transport system ATP-binding protein